MRTIRFRGQTPARNWLYGSLMVSYNGDNYIWVMDTPERLAQGMKFVTPDSVGQMTSQKDKDGKVIFEGDIIEYTLFVEGKRLFVVDYDDRSDDFVARRIGDNYTASLCSFAKDSLTVVGNTTDDPELLRQ